MTPQIVLPLYRKLTSIQRAWNASLELFWTSEYLKPESMYIASPPVERGVGTDSKSYPGSFGLKLEKFASLILVSVIPIRLKGKPSSFKRYVWKLSRLRFKLLTLLWSKENCLGDHWPLDLSSLKLWGEYYLQRTGWKLSGSKSEFLSRFRLNKSISFKLGKRCKFFLTELYQYLAVDY